MTRTTPLAGLVRALVLALALDAYQSIASAACLMKGNPFSYPPGPVYFMVAPRTEVASYQSIGFSIVKCPADRTLLRQHVEKICSTSTAKANPAINTTPAFGRSRPQACTSARAGLAEAGG
jgi:hypothetical protein